GLGRGVHRSALVDRGRVRERVARLPVGAVVDQAPLGRRGALLAADLAAAPGGAPPDAGRPGGHRSGLIEPPGAVVGLGLDQLTTRRRRRWSTGPLPAV